jgi:hypothetical protein
MTLICRRQAGLYLPASNANKIRVGAPLTTYAFSQTGLRKSGPAEGSLKPRVRDLIN